MEYGLTSAVQKRLKLGMALPAGQETDFRHLLYGEEIKWPYKKKGKIYLDKE